MFEDLFSFVTSALRKGYFLKKQYRIKSSELKTVSLSRFARDNLRNNDDATIYNNDKNCDIS